MVYLDSSLTELEIENNDNLLSDTAERKGKSNAVLFFVGSKKDSGWIAGKMLYQARKTQKQATQKDWNLPQWEIFRRKLDIYLPNLKIHSAYVVD